MTSTPTPTSLPELSHTPLSLTVRLGSVQCFSYNTIRHDCVIMPFRESLRIIKRALSHCRRCRQPTQALFPVVSSHKGSGWLRCVG